MAFKFVGFFLVLCSVADTSPDPNLSNVMNYYNLNCAVAAGLTRLFPGDYPKVERISLELRTPCKRVSYPVMEAAKIRNAPEFDATKKTVVIGGGWQTKINDNYLQRLTNAYLCRGGYNVIVVNTDTFLLTLDYIHAAYYTTKIGEFVALGVKNLNIPADDIHLIGHSLGAQIMGSAARFYAANTGKKVGRVTGLDPAKPCFVRTPVFPRLSNTDATFVDVIHSNPGETGTEEAIGQADFFPGGLSPTKPGCLPVDLSCSHMKANEYYIETVYAGNENNFMGTKCNDYQQLKARKCAGSQASMGFSASDANKGIYTLDVNWKAPYGKNAKDGAYLTILNTCGVCKK